MLLPTGIYRDLDTNKDGGLGLAEMSKVSKPPLPLLGVIMSSLFTLVPLFFSTFAR